MTRYQIAHDSWQEDHQVVTKIRGEPTTQESAEEQVAFLGGDWYVREVREEDDASLRETD
jgi:hypothetical protein